MEKFNKATSTENEELYSNLNMTVFRDADYMHMKRVSKDFEAGKLDEYHDLYPTSDTLIFTDVFEKLQNFFLKKNSFRFCKISFKSWISFARSFKKD